MWGHQNPQTTLAQWPLVTSTHSPHLPERGQEGETVICATSSKAESGCLSSLPPSSWKVRVEPGAELRAGGTFCLHK